MSSEISGSGNSGGQGGAGGSKWVEFIKRWMVTTVGVLVAARFVSGISYDNTAALLLASLVLGVLNAVLRPVMLLLSLPLVIVTLGLFTLVVNGALLLLVGK